MPKAARGRASVRRHIDESRHWILLGKLASGLVHEINNPLDGVINCLRMLRSNRLTPVQRTRYLELAEEELFRIEDLTKRLLNLARPAQPAYAPADLNALAQKSLFFIEYRLMKSGIEQVTELVPGLPEVRVDQSAILQVVVNLLINAIDSMPSGGRLTLGTGTDDRSVWLSVADTGVGIPRENLDRIFEPFFTTKDARGSGLGLSICSSVVEQHGGTIEVTSEPGKGSVFTVRLPAAS